MSFLSKEKSNNYAVVNILLFVANLMIIILTYNNPLTMKWLMILYLVLGFAQLIFIVYIFIKNNVFNEDIKINSKIYVLYDNIASILIMVSIMILISEMFFHYLQLMVIQCYLLYMINKM